MFCVILGGIGCLGLVAVIPWLFNPFVVVVPRDLQPLLPVSLVLLVDPFTSTFVKS